MMKKFTKADDEEIEQKTNNQKASCGGDVDQKGRHPPGLDIAVSHNERGVVIQPGISLDWTAGTTVTPARLNISLSVSISDEFSRTPGLDNNIIYYINQYKKGISRSILRG